MRLIKSTKDSRIGRDPRSGVWYVRTKIGGQRIHKSLDTTNENKAINLVGKKIKQALLAKSNNLSQLDSRKEFTFGDLRDPYVNSKGSKAKNTIDSAKTHLDLHLLPFFSGLLLSRINKHTWDLYVAEKRSKRKNIKLYNHAKAFNGVMKIAYYNGLIDRPLVVKSSDPKCQAGSEIEIKDLERLISDALKNIPPGQLKWYADLQLFIVIGCCGFRANEILTISWDRVDFVNRALLLDESLVKTRTKHFIKITKSAYNLLLGRHHNRESDWVFPHRRDPSRPRTTNLKAWWSLTERLGLDIRRHDLRHTAAARLLRNGWPQAMVQKYLRMSREVIDRIYSKVNERDMGQMADALEVFGNDMGENYGVGKLGERRSQDINIVRERF